MGKRSSHCRLENRRTHYSQNCNTMRAPSLLSKIMPRCENSCSNSKTNEAGCVRSESLGRRHWLSMSGTTSSGSGRNTTQPWEPPEPQRSGNSTAKPKERYQNLKYVAVQDERTRQTHRVWDGIVLPIGHKFWEVHYPPNGWNCRCHAVSTDETANRKAPKTEQRPAPPFAINYGKQGKVFGDGHPHFKVDGTVAGDAKAALIAYQQAEVRAWARKHLVGTAFQKEGREVLFTEEGVERALRQQHPEKYFQLLALQDIKEATQESQEAQGGL